MKRLWWSCLALVLAACSSSTPKPEPSGSLDSTFGQNGIVLVDASMYVRDMVRQSDGKLVLVGSTGTDFAVLRLNPDGSKDAAFGAGGLVTTDFGANEDAANAVALQADGKIVVVGQNLNRAGSVLTDEFAAARYLMDGSLDPSFGGDGKATYTFGSERAGAQAVLVQPDGGIVMAGFADLAHFTSVVVRLTPDGALDPSFDGDGKFLLPSTTYTTSGTLALAPDQKLVVGGQGNGFLVYRLQSEGSLDPSFGEGGIVERDVGSHADVIRTLAVTDGGKVVGGGYACSSAPVFECAMLITRLGDNGDPDADFGGDGVVTLQPAAGLTSYGSDLQVQGDGKYLLAGYVNTSDAASEVLLLRYTPAGELDSSFSQDGRVQFGVGHDYGEAAALVLLPDGRLLVAGNAYDGATSAGPVLARLWP